jgi:uncharacterized protein YbjT (DUF2867 family)
MILVTSGAGKTGLSILRALSSRGMRTRALVHRADQESSAMNAGANEVVIGDLLDGPSITRALHGVEAIYLICPNVHPRELEIGMAVIAAAKKARVTRFVYHSVMYPQIEEMPHHWQKLRVEEELIKSGLAFTILQPASYMQNILPYWEEITKHGRYRVPYSIDTVFSPVDLGDVAEVASLTLMDTDHDGAIYLLAGQDHLSSRQMAELAGEVLGREVNAVKQPVGDWIDAARKRGLSSYAVDVLPKMFTYYDQHGFVGSSTILEKLLGRKPTTFTQFLSRTK